MNKLSEIKIFPKVIVVLSTYNGSRYLDEMLNSLLRQDYPNISIIIRDDGSTDGTHDIIDKFCSKHSDRAFRFYGLSGNVGVRSSFLSMLDYVDDNNYLIFCDQDDVWFDNKISTFMSRMLEVEGDGDTPTLVFGDMVVTDQNLNILSSSFWAYQRIDMNVTADWRRLMMSNVVTGCSSMFNSAAVKRLRDAPQLPILHDHMGAIVVAKYGVVVPLYIQTMFYRQHENNVEGASAFGVSYLYRRIGYFLIEIFPRYIELCKAFNVPLLLAVYFKLENICRRLLRSK